MHAHFSGHVYHRHSHETYSLGVTESGAQGFTCRGAGHVSTAGLVMAFNPDDPHDGHAATGNGFTYRMIHMTPGVLTDMLADLAGAPAAMPLFAAPVITDPALAGAVRRLHRSLTGPATPLERSERLAAVAALAARHSAGAGHASRQGAGAAGLTARDRARPATTSASCGCARPGGPWRAGRPSPTPPRRPGSPTRPTSPGGSAAATGSRRALTGPRVADLAMG